MSEAILTQDTITGVELREIKSFGDSRGYFREVARLDIPFFQEGFARKFHATIQTGAASAWQCHPTQISWFYVPAGTALVRLYDLRDKSTTRGLLMERELSQTVPSLLKVPAGVACSFAALHNATAEVIKLAGIDYDEKIVVSYAPEAFTVQ